MRQRQYVAVINTADLDDVWPDCGPGEESRMEKDLRPGTLVLTECCTGPLPSFVLIECGFNNHWIVSKRNLTILGEL